MIINPYRFGGGTPGGDPYWANVTSLLYLNGANNSTTFTDETGRIWTRAASAKIVTAESLFGGSSMLNGGTNYHISSANSPGFGFGAGDFTIEGFYRPSDVSSGNRCLWDNRGMGQGIAVYVRASANNSSLAVYNTAPTQMAFAPAAEMPLNTWIHWAVARAGTTLRGFLDGVQMFSTTDSRTYTSTTDCVVGDNYLAPSQPALGNSNCIRVTKGVARYIGSFTAPTSQFPNF